MEDKFEEVLQIIGDDALQRTIELLDYAVIRLDSLLDQEFPDAEREDAEKALRTIIRSVREAADKFELGMADEDFWSAWDDTDEDDEDDLDYEIEDDLDDPDPPYWGGSNEQN